jgi:hypothetical protein
MSIEWNFMLDLRPSWVNKEQAANWENAVRREIVKMAGVNSGQVLLNSIRFHGRWVPITHYDNSQGTCNAYVDPKLGNARDGRPYGAIVYYSPHIFFPHSGCLSSDPTKNNGFQPDEILFHELVHALRRVSSKRLRTDTTGGLIQYDSNEEFYAILATNIYVSDPTNRKKSGLREDHRDGAGLPSGLAGSFDFFKSSQNAFTLVKQFSVDNPGFTKALAAVPASFNPLAAFFADPVKAQKESSSAVAVIRDSAGWALSMGRALAKFL